MVVNRKGWKPATWINLIFDTLLTFLQIRRMKITLIRTPKNITKVNISIFIISFKGGVTYIGTVYIAATRVKMWSNGQDTFWGVVKRSSSIPTH